MSIVLALICCLASPTFWGTTVRGVEPQSQQSNSTLTREQQKQLGIIQREYSNEPNDSKRQPRSSRRPEPSPTPQQKHKENTKNPNVGGSNKIELGPTPAPPTPEATMPTPISSPSSQPPPDPDTNFAFLASLVLLILVGLVTLFIMGKKIYLLARGG